MQKLTRNDKSRGVERFVTTSLQLIDIWIRTSKSEQRVQNISKLYVLMTLGFILRRMSGLIFSAVTNYCNTRNRM